MTWTHNIVGTETNGDQLRILVDYTDGTDVIHDSFYAASASANLEWLKAQISYKLTQLNAIYSFDVPLGTIDLTPSNPTTIPTLAYYVDGSSGLATIAAGQTGYAKTHFTFPYNLNGVNVSWFNANIGDYINFEVGVYTDPANEATFIPLAKFGNKFRVGGTSSETFNPNIAYALPPTYNGLDVYVRTTYVNTGSADASILVNLLGLK